VRRPTPVPGSGRSPSHHFVFAGKGLKTYGRPMPFHSCRRFVATITAALFIVSAVTHQIVAAGMSTEAGMAMSAAALGTASHDNMPCPMSSDCSKDMNMPATACFAHCATVLGIVCEPVQVRISNDARNVPLPVMRRLASLHSPPEPPPPKRSS
jgi:hypothetical protein